MSCGVLNRDLRFSQEQAINIENKKIAELTAGHQLILVLDLDHTILHSYPGELSVPGTKVFSIENNHFTTKFRPHLQYFLETVKDKYEIYVNTMGTTLYAHALMKIIDPDQKYIPPNRIFSK